MKICLRMAKTTLNSFQCDDPYNHTKLGSCEFALRSLRFTVKQCTSDQPKIPSWTKARMPKTMLSMITKPCQPIRRDSKGFIWDHHFFHKPQGFDTYAVVIGAFQKHEQYGGGTLL